MATTGAPTLFELRQFGPALKTSLVFHRLDHGWCRCVHDRKWKQPFARWPTLMSTLAFSSTTSFDITDIWSQRMVQKVQLCKVQHTIWSKTRGIQFAVTNRPNDTLSVEYRNIVIGQGYSSLEYISECALNNPSISLVQSY